MISPDAGRRIRNTSTVGAARLPQLLPALNGTSGAPHKTHSRMLRSRQGERGISFHPWLQDEECASLRAV